MDSDEGYIIEISPQEHSTIHELVISYLRAVERFRAQDSLRSDLDLQLLVESLGRSALAEALNWADAIDQYLQTGPRSDERDPEWVHRLPASDLAQGFQRVRNLVHHRWWQAVVVQLQMRQGVQINEWCWADLPTASRKGQGKDSLETPRMRHACEVAASWTPSTSWPESSGRGVAGRSALQTLSNRDTQSLHL